MFNHSLLRTLITATLLVSQMVFADFASDLQNESRDQADRDRDAGRKPVEVLGFLGVKPGDTVIDVLAAGGYYTEVLSHAVGPFGRVYAQNTALMLTFREGANDIAMTKRLADKRLQNVRRLDKEMQDLGIEPNSVDAAITALNFHDVYNNSGKEATVGFSKLILATLKPGGVFGVIDHQGEAAQDNNKLHRMPVSLAIEALKEAGFEIEATSTILASSDDDHSQMVFSPTIRGKTDRFVIKAIKPLVD
jgi:predicted methyltransferase